MWLLGLLACGPGPAPQPWVFALPDHFPEAPAGVTAEAAALGARLFDDPGLSRTGTHSCASCHLADRAFAGTEALPIGATGEVLPRNAPSLGNVGWLDPLTWMGPSLHTLEHQALIPLFATEPIELGATPDRLQAHLSGDPELTALYRAAFPGRPITAQGAVDGLAAFQRTLVSADAPWDRAQHGQDVLSEAASRGEALFRGRLGCAACHVGPLFTDLGFHATGLYDADGTGRYPGPNVGLYVHTGDAADMGRFRTPSLRNVGRTAPYMHDGSIPDLDGVLDHYAAGGRARSARTDPLVRPFPLSGEDRADLKAFLVTLDEPAFGAAL